MYLLDWIVDFLNWLQSWIPPSIYQFLLPVALIGAVAFFTFLPSIGVYTTRFLISLRLNPPQLRRRRKLSITDELEIELLNQCQGDKELARRLYRQTRERYPDRTDKEWLLYKTLGDLAGDRQNSTIPKYTSPKPATTTKSKPQNNPNLKTNGVLESKILRLVQGNKEVANRLLRHAKDRNPGKSYEWYLQKVIWDLERDRRI